VASIPSQTPLSVGFNREVSGMDDEMNVLLEDVKDLIRSARRTVARGVNHIQVMTNYEIGRRIVEHEQKGEFRAEYSSGLIEGLSERLTAEYGRGYSTTNLKLMRQFYLMYSERLVPSDVPPDGLRIGQSMTVKFDPNMEYTEIGYSFTLSWTHYVFLVKLKDEDERSFYEIEASNNGWSVKELRRQFDTSLYERLSLSKDKDKVRSLSTKGQMIESPEDMLKEPYVLEFLGIPEDASLSESEVESAIISKIERFLMEMGKGFLFEARQKRFTFDEDHFYVDLVLYNRLLRCYVVIDLKIGKVTHQNLGQMQMYVNYFDRYVKEGDENPTIGIILCREQNDAVVKLTLPEDVNIYPREYTMVLPSKEELRRKLLE